MLFPTDTFYTLTAEYKFRDSFDFDPYARLVFSANHPPRSADASHAFFRRWVVVPFDRTFEPHEQIPGEKLDKMLQKPAELSGMLNRALDALGRLEARGGFSEPESERRAWEDFHATTDPLAVWLDRFTVDDPGVHVPRTQLRVAYNSHCEQRGRPGLGEKSFGMALQRLRPVVEAAQRTVNRRRTWCYIGIGLFHPDDNDARGARDARDNPSINLSHGSSQDSERSERSVRSVEQDRAYPVHPVHGVQADCEHEWVREPAQGGRDKQICGKCGKFYGFFPEDT